MPLEIHICERSGRWTCLRDADLIGGNSGREVGMLGLRQVEERPDLRNVSDSAAEGPLEGEPMKIGSAFPSNYIKKEDLGSARPVLSIERVEVELVGQGDNQENKPVLYFQGKEKGLVLNVGNAQSIVEIVGDDETDNWTGHKVQLYVDPNVMFGKQKVGGIRIGAPPASAPAKGKAKAAPVPAAEEFQVDDSDVPF